MKPADSSVIDHLNAVLKNELTSINQYFLHSRMLKNWGLNRLADHEYHESLDEMKHADLLVERILLLEGLPNLQSLGILRVGENPQEVLSGDLELELEAIPALRSAIEIAETAHDFVSREIFARILESEEEHVDWLETQIELMERLGTQRYFAEQLHSE